MIVISSMSLRLMETAQTRLARTLSRDFWQQKNFRAHRLRVSSPFAKTGFSRESIAADSRLLGAARVMHRRLW